MASAQDIYDALNSANAKLEAVRSEVAANTAVTQQVRQAVDSANQTLVTGFDVMSADAVALGAIATQQCQLLLHISQQNDSILCFLDKLARQSCATLNYAATQTRLLSSVESRISLLVKMYEIDNPASALTISREEELIDKIEKCCPPDTPEPECVYHACDIPDPVNEFETVEVPRFPHERPIH